MVEEMNRMRNGRSGVYLLGVIRLGGREEEVWTWGSGSVKFSTNVLDGSNVIE